MSQNDLQTRVVEYLDLARAGDVAGARLYLDPEARFTTAGGREFASVEEMIVSSATRRKWSQKAIETIDVATRDQLEVVYVSGTLRGETLDGQSYSGIRFIDRFIFRDGRILEHSVWNDLAYNGL